MPDVKELNPCISDRWIQEFNTTDPYQHISKSYKHIASSYREVSLLKAALHHTVYETSRQFLEEHRILDTIPYYYIKFLLETNPKSILDLGCGLNVFKDHLPGIIGMDADEKTPCDFVDYFDQEFAHGHKHQYDSVISINAIHFAPITTIAERIKWTAGLVKTGGRVFVSFNLETWLMYSDKETIQLLFDNMLTFDAVVNYVDTQISDTGLDFIVKDWPVLHTNEHSTIRDDLNGNIRLVFNV
jgi:hypothetical protein